MRGLADVFAGWITRYRIDGFRIDTARHVERGFFVVWVPRILAAARAAGVPDFQLFGEAFITNAVELSDVRARPRAAERARLPDAGRARPVRRGKRGRRWNRDAPSTTTTTSSRRAANDTCRRRSSETTTSGAPRSRCGTRAARGAAGPLLQKTLLAYDLLYLLRGAPVVYYGDEFGIVGRGGDKEARHDLFPTQVPEWQSEERIGSGPIGTGSSFDVVGPSGRGAAARARRPARLASGALDRRDDRAARDADRARHEQDRRGRRGASISRSSTRARSAARVTIPTATPQSEWTRLLGTTTPASSTRSGSLTLTVPPSRARCSRRRGRSRRPGRPGRRSPSRATRSATSFASLRRRALDRSASPSRCAAATRRAGRGSPPTTRRRTERFSTPPSSTGASASTWSRSHGRSTAAPPSRQFVPSCRVAECRRSRCPSPSTSPARPSATAPSARIWRTSGTKAACTASSTGGRFGSRPRAGEWTSSRSSRASTTTSAGRSTSTASTRSPRATRCSRGSSASSAGCVPR